VLAVLGGWGCANDRDDSPADVKPAPLRIAAASDLQHALPKIVSRFTEQSKREVTVTFGSSGQLAEQIKGGAPFDLFLAANRSFVETLAQDGLIQPDSLRNYAQGSLVLVVHDSASRSVHSLKDLTRVELKKIALANPETAPYGAAGKQALERAGLWTELQAKVVRSESVAQALQFVRTGNAEAGLVGLGSARVSGLNIVPIDPSLYDPIVQGLGLVSRSGRTDKAREFMTFLLGEPGQSMLRDFGFLPAEARSASHPRDEATQSKSSETK